MAAVAYTHPRWTRLWLPLFTSALTANYFLASLIIRRPFCEELARESAPQMVSNRGAAAGPRGRAAARARGQQAGSVGGGGCSGRHGSVDLSAPWPATSSHPLVLVSLNARSFPSLIPGTHLAAPVLGQPRVQAAQPMDQRGLDGGALGRGPLRSGEALTVWTRAGPRP
jgi:hypothetical protein